VACRPALFLFLLLAQAKLRSAAIPLSNRYKKFPIVPRSASETSFLT